MGSGREGRRKRQELHIKVNGRGRREPAASPVPVSPTAPSRTAVLWVQLAVGRVASGVLAEEQFLQFAEAGFGGGVGLPLGAAFRLGGGAGLPVIFEGSDGPARARVVKHQFPPLPPYVQVQRGAVPRYYLSNAPEGTTWETLAYVGGSRWYIETEFETEKGDVGLDEYETRSWAGWHHHIAMCLLGGAFLLSLQQDWGKKDAPDHPSPEPALV